jgi:hypothetical protein
MMKDPFFWACGLSVALVALFLLAVQQGVVGKGYRHGECWQGMRIGSDELC